MDVYYWQCLTNPYICSLQGLKSFRETQIQIQVQYTVTNMGHKYKWSEWWHRAGGRLVIARVLSNQRSQRRSSRTSSRRWLPNSDMCSNDLSCATTLMILFFSSFRLQRILTEGCHPVRKVQFFWTLFKRPLTPPPFIWTFVLFCRGCFLKRVFAGSENLI